MRAALPALHFGAHHAVTDVAYFADDGLRGGLPEAGPAAARFELGARVEQRRAAAHAAIDAVAVVVPVQAGERRLGGAATRHAVLLLAQFAAPEGVIRVFGGGLGHDAFLSRGAGQAGGRRVFRRGFSVMRWRGVRVERPRERMQQAAHFAEVAGLGLGDGGLR